MKHPDESKHIHHYPFDDKDKKEKYNASYRIAVVCSNCGTAEYVRITHGIRTTGLKYICNNCKCSQIL